VVHVVSVEHARCPEHGEPIHVADRGTSTASDGHWGLSPMSVPSVGGSPSVPDEHGDEHCGHACVANEHDVAVHSAELDARLALASATDVPPDTEVIAHVAQYRLAPKQSPPV
jgi:hypothetical protein